MSAMKTPKGYARRRFAQALTMTALLAFTFVGTAAVAATTISFGVPSWPGERVKAEVAEQILQAAGYKTSSTNASWIIDLKAVSTGQLSADMALWRPTQNSVLDPMLKSGKVVLLATNIKDALYGMVVPDYVWKAGVHSIGDLHKYAAKFDHKIYGIEAGNDGNTLVINAIKSNQYDLKGFHLVPSSTAGMLEQAKNAIANHQWIVFLGWKPHWMNVVFNIKYLNDPEKMWGGVSTVNTVVTPAFEKDHPNVARFLKQMLIPSKVQSQWIYDYGYKKTPLKTVAAQWIKSNPDMVKQWLEGVTMADGSGSAFDAVQKVVGS